MSAFAILIATMFFGGFALFGAGIVSVCLRVGPRWLGRAGLAGGVLMLAAIFIAANFTGAAA